MNHGIWFLSERGRSAGKYALVAGFVFTIIFILISELLPDPETIIPAVPSMITTGLVPFHDSYLYNLFLYEIP